MKTKKNVLIIIIVAISILCCASISFLVVYSTNPKVINNLFNLIDTEGIKKPAIYLYPKQATYVDVSLGINGVITKSIPDYNQGWHVYAEPIGMIDNKYDYLFYEADIKNPKLTESGWVVDYNQLESWFKVNLPKLGLNVKETEQFIDYWIKELPFANYYEIKLLEQDFLSENMTLNINPKPDTLIRLEFYFKPLDKKTFITEPVIKTPIRKGFTVVEWGGILGKK